MRSEPNIYYQSIPKVPFRNFPTRSAEKACNKRNKRLLLT